MNLKWLELFCYIVEEGSLSAAGRRAYITQPSVTKYMNSLEDHYGSLLLHRTNGSVSPTSTGYELYEHAKTILSEYYNSLEAIEHLETGIQKQIIVGASYTIGEYIMPSVLARYQQLYPDSAIHLEINNTRTILRQLDNQQVDVAFIEGELTDQRLKKQVISYDHVQLVVGPTHPWAKRSSIYIKELMNEPYIARESKSSTRRIVERKLKERLNEYEVTPHLELNTNQAVKNAIQTGLGYGFASYYAVRHEIHHGLLVSIPLVNCKIERPFWRVKKPLRFEKPALETFEAIVSETLQTF
ncbi:LysR family transcriptional regulator [Alkalicoccobacillus gibsonii]|uniref:LysR family transcriptional regulator n=1 Tax=Alkalicoccobacillus gibsonii TaxID=79881 RepID=A0ABU9VEP6_9BACI